MKISGAEIRSPRYSVLTLTMSSHRSSPYAWTVDRAEVIDGQQRLTTLTILLAITRKLVLRARG